MCWQAVYYKGDEENQAFIYCDRCRGALGKYYYLHTRDLEPVCCDCVQMRRLFSVQIRMCSTCFNTGYEITEEPDYNNPSCVNNQLYDVCSLKCLRIIPPANHTKSARQ